VRMRDVFTQLLPETIIYVQSWVIVKVAAWCVFARANL